MGERFIFRLRCLALPVVQSTRVQDFDAMPGTAGHQLKTVGVRDVIYA